MCLSCWVKTKELFQLHGDYPEIERHIFSEIGYNKMRDGRPIFCVGGLVFFRRYANDWDPAIIKPYLQYDGMHFSRFHTVYWHDDTHPEFLTNLYNLLLTKPASITFEEITAIM